MENDDELKKLIDKRIREVVPLMLQTSAFINRKLTDTPLDKNQVVPRAYVTNNGTVRPASSVIGQPFYDFNLASGRGRPITWNGIGWTDADGTYV